MNKLSQFWQELKRRKVIKVLALYAGTAYILIELANNVVEPLNLPVWTPRVVILVALIGFPITVILSWIFDLTPEGLMKTESKDDLPEDESIRSGVKRKLKASDLIIAALFISVCVLLYPKIFNGDKFEDIREADGRISIAVMPFENMTGDTTLNWFQRGISSLIINGLGNSSELSVRDDQTMYEVMESMDQVFTAGISTSKAREVAEKARSGTFISGSYQGKDGKYWVLVNLVDTESGHITWTNKVEGDLRSSGYLDLVDSLCIEIKNYLEIKVLEQEADYDFREAYTKSAEAYRYFIEGMNSVLTTDYESAVQSLKKALEIDSTFAVASFYIALAYNFGYQFEQDKIWTQKTYTIKDKLPSKYQLWEELWYAISISENLADIIRYCNLLEESGMESRLLWFDLGTTYYSIIEQYEKAVIAFEKVEEIGLERDNDWKNESYYDFYGKALHKVGNYKKSKEISELGERFFPNSYTLKFNQSISALSLGDTSEANDYLEKTISAMKESGFLAHDVEAGLGRLYHDANIIDKAELHFRNAVELKPRNIWNIYGLARFLIIEDINVSEGMELIQKAIEISPDEAYLLLPKALGLHKQGNFEEAIQLLKRVDDVTVGYNPEVNQQIQEVEQAIASQGN